MKHRLRRTLNREEASENGVRTYRFAREINSAAGPYRIADNYINLDQARAGRPLFTFPNPFPSGLGTIAASQSITGFPSEANNGVIHQFNVTLEKEYHRIGLRASYIGSRSHGLNYALSLNKPQPGTATFVASRRPYPQFVALRSG